MSGIYHTLVKEGMWHAMVSAFVNVFIFGVLLGSIRGFLRRRWREHLEAMRDHHLDPPKSPQKG